MGSDNDVMATVVVPVYNAAKYLDECIESIVSQTFRDFELILLPGASTDNSTEICEKWAERDSRVVLIEQDKPNWPYARNKAIKRARGKYICACDADDLYCLEYLEKMVQTAEKDNSDIVECMFYIANEDLSELSIYEGLSFVNEWGHDFLERHCSPAVWKYIVRKDFWVDNQLEYPESRTMADLGMYSLVFSLSKKTSYIFEPLYIYRVFDSSISHKKTNADIKLEAFERVCHFITSQFKTRNLFEMKRLVLQSQIENHAGDLYSAIEIDSNIDEITDRISTIINKYYETTTTTFDLGVLGWGRNDLENLILLLRKNPSKDISFVGDVELYNLVSQDLQKQLIELVENNDFDIVVLDFISEALSIKDEIHNLSTCVKRWSMGAQIFASALNTSGMPKVFLLERYLSEKHCSEGKVELFDDIGAIQVTNDILKKMYESFTAMYPNTVLIKAVSNDQNISRNKDMPLATDLTTSYYYEQILDQIHMGVHE